MRWKTNKNNTCPLCRAVLNINLENVPHCSHPKCTHQIYWKSYDRCKLHRPLLLSDNTIRPDNEIISDFTSRLQYYPVNRCIIL